MGWLASAELAAAVSNAGALGMLSPTGGAGPDQDWVENLRIQIRKTKDLTDKPFGVNIWLEEPRHKELIDTAIEEGVGIVATAAGSPALYTKYLKERGIKVMHPVFSVRHARRGEAEGLDAVIASGVDAGGLLSRDELTTLVLVPQVVDVVKIPVIAAGGIVDERGAVAAFALGAEAIQMGTRFIATKEAPVHQNVKDAIVAASELDTRLVMRPLRNTERVLTNPAVERLLEIEKEKGADLQFSDVIEQVAGVYPKIMMEGTMDAGAWSCGMVAGLINDIPTCQELIDRIMVEAEEIIRGRLEGFLAG